MAPVLIPLAITAGTSALAVGLGAVTITAAITAVATTAITAGAGYLLSKQQDESVVGQATEGPAAAPANAQRNVVVKQALPPRRFVYGNCRVGGVLIFQDNVNPDLFLMQALSDGVIESIDYLYIGETLVPISGTSPVTGNAYAGHMEVEYRLGTTTQTASALITAAFPSTIDSNFRQLGVATAAVQLDWGADATQHNALWGDGIAPTYFIKGVKVIDPRVVGTSPTSSSTHSYSSSPPLCVAHALVNAWDLKIGYGDIDWQSFADAADDCDVTTTYAGNTVPLFTLAGVFQSGAQLATQVAGMLSSFGGALYFWDGKYRVRADKARSSVWTLTDVDLLEVMDYQHEGASSETPNAIKASFPNADDGGQDDSTPVYEWPGTSGEAVREVALSLAFTPCSHSAQIIAYRELARARDGRTLSIQTHDAGLYLEPLDVITISSVNLPFLNGDFQVIQVDMSSPGAILQLRGYATDAYDDPTAYLQ